MKIRHLIVILSILICAAAFTQSDAAYSAEAQPLTNQDVIKLLREDKRTAEQVKERLKGTASNFDLSEAGIKQLLDVGVDASVLAAMIQSPKFKGDWYVADLYEYLDAIQLSGTNYVPSLFSPIAPGVVYVVLLALLWLGISWLSNEANKHRTKILGVVIIVFLFVSGVLISFIDLPGRFYSTVAVSEVSLGFIAKPISPDQDPCSQIQRRPSLSTLTASSVNASAANITGSIITEQPRLDPLTKFGVRESDSASSKLGGPQEQATDTAKRCRQPETSATPQTVAVGKVSSPEGGMGDVYLNHKKEGYVLTVSNVRRAGKYTGRISSDVIAPAALPVTLNVSDWWPYFFVAVALGILFTNRMIMPRLQLSLPHGEALGTNREVAEAFAQGVNSVPVTTLSSLAAALAGLYANYNGSGVWGGTTDYVMAFLGGAAITLGLRTLAGAANAAATRLERAFKREPPHFVNEVHLQPPTDNK